MSWLEVRLLAQSKIAFIGPGVMAEAMIGGLVRGELARGECLIASGPRQERVEKLAAEYSSILLSSENLKS